MKQKEVGSCMSRHPHVTSRKSKISEALKLMSETNVRHLPVIENNEVVGMLTDRDIKQFSFDGSEDTAVVEDIMAREPYFVEEGVSVSEVCSMMAKKKFGSVVIVNEAKEVRGIFTTIDALNLLAQLTKDGRHPELENFYAVHSAFSPF